MNKKVLWFIAFGVVTGLSCWATASSFMLIIPLPWFVIWAMTIVFFVFSSFAFKLIMDALLNDGSVENPKAKLWGGIALLLLTWVVISLPTNAHTFFYKLQVKNVITQDLKTTEVYTTQLAKREYRELPDDIFPVLRDNCQNELLLFKDEASGNGPSRLANIDKLSLKHIDNINAMLGKEGKYSMYRPHITHNANDTRSEINTAEGSLATILDLIDKDKYRIDVKFANQARVDLDNIKIMQEVIDSLIQIGRLSHPSSEPIIKQTEGVLSLAYTNINMHHLYTRFNSEDDAKLYTAINLETRTSRFLHPYKVLGDFFVGKIPIIFIFWLILSILLDVIGFISFDLALKKEFDF